MENKSEGNEKNKKKILGKFNCTMDKTDRDSGKKIKRLYICGFNYSLSKLTVDKGLEDL